MSSKSRTRSRVGVGQILEMRHAELAGAWVEAWRTRVDRQTDCSEADLAVLRAWSEDLLVQVVPVVASGDAQPSAAAFVANSSRPDVALPVAMAAIVHLDRWFASHLRTVFHYELRSHERLAFCAVVDAALREVARAAQEEHERSLQFVDMLAHDLRAPLGAVIFVTSTLVRSGHLAHDKRRALLRIEHSANRMQHLVDELLGFARARAMLPIHRDAVALDVLCRRVADETSAAHAGRLVAVSSTGDTAGSWDAARLAQVIQNLVENALCYSPLDSVVRVSIRGDDPVRLSVSNVGEPIPAEKLERIFEPYHHTASGLGLGLYIVKEFVRAHGGTVAVTSTKDDGTTFAVSLPRRHDRPEERPALRRSS